MKITRELLFDNRTPRGAWRKAQIEALGLPWPLVEGWIDRAVGREVTADQVFEFIRQREKQPDQMMLC